MADFLFSAVPCWSIPPSQCINASRIGVAPIQGVPARRRGRRGLPLAVSQLAAAESPPGYLARTRRPQPRSTAVLTPVEDAVSLQQLLLAQQQQREEQEQQQQQQHHESSADAGYDSTNHSQDQKQPINLPYAVEQVQSGQDLLQLVQSPPYGGNVVPLLAQQQVQAPQVVQTQHHHHHHHHQQQQQQPDSQLHTLQQQGISQQPARHQHHQQQQQEQAVQAHAPQQQQQLPQQQLWLHNGQQRHQQLTHQQAPQPTGQQQQQLRQQQQDSSDAPQQQRQARSGYLSRAAQPGHQCHQHQHNLLQQQQQQQQHQQPEEAFTQQEQQQRNNTQPHSSRSSDGSSTGRSSRSRPRGASAYTVVPTTTAPSITQASAAAIAAAAAAAAAARARSGKGYSSSSSVSSAAAAAAAGSSGDVLLPPAEECVPQALWGLMNEELRPWHKQVLVHLCYVLPPPACYIYRDMRPSKMQRVLAQRAMMEKELRGHLTELLHQQQQIRGWLSMLQARQPRVDRTLNPDSVRQTQQQLLNLKAALGRTRYTLHTLQDRAAAYSDRDYVQYSQGFAELLSEMEGLADLQRDHAVPVVLKLHQLQEAAARRVLFARTQQAVVALQREAAVLVQHVLQSEQQALDSSKQRLDQLRKGMQECSWRYPPPPYIAWRFKGQPKGAKPPWARTPGVQRKEPKARQGVEQLLQPGVPPSLLDS